MADFDDLFKRRLEEEALFPNRAHNWQQVSGRLDAFQLGQKQVRLWRTVAVSALALLACSVVYNYQYQQEYQRTQQELSQFQTIRQQLEQEKEQQKRASELQTGEISEIRRMVSEIKEENARLSHHIRQHQPTTYIPTQMVGVSGNIATEMPLSASASLLEKSHLMPPSETTTSAIQLQAPTTTVEQPILSSSPIVDTLSSTTAPVAPPPADESIAAPVAAAPLPITEPVQRRNYRFLAGIRGSFGQVAPRQDGITALTGEGVVAEYHWKKGLRFTANADRLKYEECSTEYRPKFHGLYDSLPQPKDNWGSGGGGGGGHHNDYKLKKIEGVHHQMRLGLGIQYVIPVRFWAQPTLNLSHEWVRNESSSLVFHFEEDDHGGPGGPGPQGPDQEYLIQPDRVKWVSNQWVAGIGLEKSLPRWVISMGADYNQNLSPTTPAFNAWFLRAGVKYKIL